MKKHIPFILVSLLISSCEYSFDVESPIREPILSFKYISGMNTSCDSTCYFEIELLSPVGGKMIENNEYVIQKLNFTADGKEVEWEREINVHTGEPGTRYKAKMPNLPETKLELYMEAEGLKPISASVVIPEKPDFKYNCFKEKTTQDEDNTNYIVEVIVDNVRDEDYLGIKIDWDSGWGQRPTLYIKGVGADYSLMNSPDYMFYHWEDDFFFLIGKNEIQNGKLYFQTELGFETKEDMRIKLYRFSPETYSYFFSSYNNAENVLGHYNLAPPVFVYTNIKSGFGILGAASCTELKMEFNEQTTDQFSDRPQS